MSAVAPARLPDDADARSLISQTGTGRTLFVEAGAGTGKTTQLVDRIVNTVIDDGVALSEIAAITFTDAAASELQSRIRAGFERVVADDDASEHVRERAAQAVADADLASISTVHGFARRLLGEFSVAAGLPPRLGVLDEISSQLAHEQRWERFVDALHADPDNDQLLYRTAVLKIAFTARYTGQASLREVADAFAQNWDRLEGFDAAASPLPDIDFAPFDRSVEALAEVATTCVDPDDKLYAHIVHTCLPSMQGLRDVVDPGRKLRLAVGTTWNTTSSGTKAAWGRPGVEVREFIKDVNRALESVVSVQSDAVLDRLMRLIGREVLDAAKARVDDGGLEFHDLLVMARRLLRGSPEVRNVLHDRYRHILLDEFQDTDPIQIEVASLIAATPLDPQPDHWSDHRVSEGRLFFVGDPKQSIYRFRRADIELFLAARDAFGGGDGPVSLTTNFRTVAPIIDWVNGVFSEAMPEEIPGAQPGYEPLRSWRTADSGAEHRPVVFGGVHDDPKVRAGVLRQAEADDVAAIIADIVARPGAWPVWDRTAGEWRPARLGDVTILIPTRTSLPYLRDALDQSDLPYRLATGTLVYDTQEVRDLLAALRTIDDPTDTLSLISTLRSPLYGCADTDLYEFHQHRSTWDLADVVPDGLDADHPVVAAIAHLRSLWRDRWWLGPAAMLDRLVRERRGFLLAHGDPRPTEVWRRLRFLLDQARSFEESVGGDLRAFLTWAELQSADNARVHEPMLPETDDDAAQILTVHGSKGLEFPITILSGMTTQAGGRRNGVSVLWDDDDLPQVKLKTGLSTVGHQPRADLEEEMGGHEKLRLLYVAATRARDHLVVSGHHKLPNPKAKGAAAQPTFAQRCAEFATVHPDLVAPAGRVAAPAADTSGSDAPDDPPGPGSLRSEGSTVDDALERRRTWLVERDRLLAPMRRPRAMSATAIAATADPSLVDVDADDVASSVVEAAAGDNDVARPAVRKRGRAGSAVGRAVHATLEVIDFETPDDLRALVERQCDLEAITDLADSVEALVRSALGSESLALAKANRSHRELYVGTRIGETMVEGYVDLLIVTPKGLVVVDYKTDSVATAAQADAKLETYELQGAAYAVAVEQATGLDVVECRFVFCTTGDPIERSVADLDGAKHRVRTAVMSATAGP